MNFRFASLPLPQYCHSARTRERQGFKPRPNRWWSAALTVATPERLIESCTALIENPATPEADRLDAMITRAVALHNHGQTDKALAEISPAMIAEGPRGGRAPIAPAVKFFGS